jgi:pyruvate dehydrogenase E2 component (dihydrolipoamide acetyltransferase)
VPKEIRMPKLSDTMEEGTLLAWRKRPGEQIKRGEVLADIETDKADMEFESFTEGTIQALCVDQGATVPVGTLIAVIRLPGESEEEAAAASKVVQEAAPEAAAPAPAAPPTPTPPPATAPDARPPGVGGERLRVPFVEEPERIRATPRARRMAEERSLDLTEIEGSGPGGSILVSDVESYLTQLEAQEPVVEGVRATPVALRIAGELGVDLEFVKGSGPASRITKADVLEHVKRAGKLSVEREAELFRGAQQLSQKRKALIRNMIRSKAEAPHFYVSMQIRTDALKALRDRLNQDSGEERTRLTYTHLMLKASAMALEKYPEANATYRAEENHIAIFEGINIGLAVDVHDELVAPTIKDCQGKGVFQLAEEANALIQRARMRKLQPHDYADGTFTISNLGMFGVDSFYAIITPPQSSILSVGTLEQRPIVSNGQFEIGTMTTLGLSVDHRVLDGVKASQFLAEIKRLLENPEELVHDGHSFGN